MNYTDMLHEMNALPRFYETKKSYDFSIGGTPAQKALLVRWGVKEELFASMKTSKITKVIGMGQKACVEGFVMKADDGYGTDVSWLMCDGDCPAAKPEKLVSDAQAKKLAQLGVEYVTFNGCGNSPCWTFGQAGMEIKRLTENKKAARAAKKVGVK